nr:ORF43 [Acipenserid herpesvirus 1]
MLQHVRLVNIDTALKGFIDINHSSKSPDHGFAARLLYCLKKSRVSRQGWDQWQPFITLITKLFSASLYHPHLTQALEGVERALKVEPATVNPNLSLRRAHLCELILQAAARLVGPPPLNLYRDPDVLHLLSPRAIKDLAMALECDPDDQDVKIFLHQKLNALPLLLKSKSNPLPTRDLLTRASPIALFKGGCWDPDLEPLLTEACKRLRQNKLLPPSLRLSSDDPRLKLTRALVRARPQHPRLKQLTQELGLILNATVEGLPVAMLMEAVIRQQQQQQTNK